MEVLLVMCAAYSNFAGTRILHAVILRNIVINLYVKRLWPLNTFLLIYEINLTLFYFNSSVVNIQCYFS